MEGLKTINIALSHRAGPLLVLLGMFDSRD
jgi:hypothetical protein